MVRVEVAYSPAPRQIEIVALQLASGSTLADAVKASGIATRHGLDPGAAACGVWGRRRPPEHPLRDGDRVEIYRGLAVDPKQARRLRYARDKKEKRPARAGR
jgi:putative ubiquitin-RnfH superfamily antitoxin RatB of RatAB toxin-antitoxin module